MKRPDCTKCKFFLNTWETHLPYSCAAFGIKSRRMPNLAVYVSTGKECPAFQPTETKKKNSEAVFEEYKDKPLA